MTSLTNWTYVYLTCKEFLQLRKETHPNDGWFQLEGLKGAADADGDKLITSGEAYEYVFKNVSHHTQNMQHPIKKGEEERPIILGVIK